MVEPSLTGLLESQILTSELLSFLHPPRIDTWEIVVENLRDVCRLASTCSSIRDGMRHRLEVSCVDLQLLRMSPNACHSLFNLCHRHCLKSIRGAPLFSDFASNTSTPLSEERALFWNRLVERVGSEFTSLELFEPTSCRDYNLFVAIPNPSLLNGLTQMLRKSPTVFDHLTFLNLSGYTCPREDALNLLRELQNVKTLRTFIACELMAELTDEEIIEYTIDSFPSLIELHLRRCKRVDDFVDKLGQAFESRITEFINAVNKIKDIPLKQRPDMDDSTFTASLLEFQRVAYYSPLQRAVGNFNEPNYFQSIRSKPDFPLVKSIESFLEKQQIFNSSDGSRIVYPRLQIVQMKDYWQQGPWMLSKVRANKCTEHTCHLEIKRKEAIDAVLSTSWGRELKERIHDDQVFSDAFPYVSFIAEAGRWDGGARFQLAQALGFSLTPEPT